jgi:hypothetical protein
MSIEKWVTKIFDFRKWHVATNANALTLRPLSGAERTLVSHPRGLVSEFTPEFQTLPLVFIQRFSIPSCAGGFFVTERFISFGSSRPYICFIVLICIRRLMVRSIIASRTWRFSGSVRHSSASFLAMPMRTDASPTEALQSEVATTLRGVTKLSGSVELVPIGTLPNDGKVIFDER